MHVNRMHYSLHSVDKIPVLSRTYFRIVAGSTRAELVVPIEEKSEIFIA